MATLSRLVGWPLAVLFVGVLGLMNVRLHTSGAVGDAAEDDRRILEQLAFVKSALDDGAGERAQGLFPEGYFFLHVLYGLAWVEVGARAPAGSAERERAVRESAWALERLDSFAGVAPFGRVGGLPRGVFHAGWWAMLAGKHLSLLSPADRDPDLVAAYQRRCRELADAFVASPTPFLSAYPGGCWPVDSVVAIAALRLHDRAAEPAFGGVVDDWVGKARSFIDPATGMLPHRSDPANGAAMIGARGSSQSVIAVFLPGIDRAWATEHYRHFREALLVEFMGAPAIREYPRGVDGVGDVDSGPLVFGVSLSASVVAMGAARTNGDAQLAHDLADIGEAAGMPMTWGGRKRYAMGVMPIGDAFVAWAKSLPLADKRITGTPSASWRWKWHVASLLAAGVVLAPLVVIERRAWMRRRRARGQTAQ